MYLHRRFARWKRGQPSFLQCPRRFALHCAKCQPNAIGSVGGEEMNAAIQKDKIDAFAGVVAAKAARGVANLEATANVLVIERDAERAETFIQVISGPVGAHGPGAVIV